MSTPSIPTPTDDAQTLDHRALSRAAVRPLRAIAFWSAIALPFLYIPLLFVEGLQTGSHMTAFFVLVALHVVSVVVGHRHGSD
ncbi:hypothetical protein [Natronorarus salvus]|uniref:hypothetical protein n=1 Tax=Natronorarus salvus TaxID=3117733 RepID=UPI002F263892